MGTNRARTKSTTPQLARALEYRGLLTRVAKRLNLDRTHVGRVARGHRSSRKVVAALLAEINRIERRAA